MRNTRWKPAASGNKYQTRRMPIGGEMVARRVGEDGLTPKLSGSAQKGRLRRRGREQAGTVTGVRCAAFGSAHTACQARFLRRVSYRRKLLRTGALSAAATG